MKKIKKIWGKNRRFWKKYRAALWIEGIFLCIIAVCAGGLYWTEKNNQLENAREVMQSIQTDIYEKAAGGGTAKEVERLAAEEIMDTVGEAGEIVYGINFQVYKKNGYTAGSISGRHLSCVWRSETEDGFESEWIPMEEYFTEEELSGFYDYFTENGNNERGRTGCYIRQMTGVYSYYLDAYIPIEIIFADYNTADEEYVLQNASKMESSAENQFVYRVDHVTQDTLEFPGQTETGYFSLYTYMQPDDLYSRASKLTESSALDIVEGNIDNSSLEGGESLWEKQITGNEEIGGYSCAICADTLSMARLSGHLRQVMLPIVLFFQSLAVFVICVYLYIKKKQEKLAAMRDTFINAIAHEMKTPAAVIQNSTECIQAGIHPEKQAHYLQIINHEAGHMNELLNSMLTYTRVTDAVCQIKNERCSLEKISEDVCGHYTDAMERKQISLVWDKNEPEQVLCDIKLMEMVLDNFVSNAVKFCVDGGVIRISISKKNLAIFNEGKGLAEDEIRHIWEPLYRGDESRTFESGSSGMGLAISGAILKIHGADFGVKNVPDGVEFYINMK